MLVLSRKKGESLKLGDDIEITILKLTNGQVSIGIKAPRQLAIIRGELAAAMLEENRSAVQSAPDEEELGRLSKALGDERA